MSYSKGTLYPPNPVTTRGAATKLSAGKDKVAYTSGRTVLVCKLSISSSVDMDVILILFS